jgi:hypothetical protein
LTYTDLTAGRKTRTPRESGVLGALIDTRRK